MLQGVGRVFFSIEGGFSSSYASKMERLPNARAMLQIIIDFLPPI